jgi:hypothetical protein
MEELKTRDGKIVRRPGTWELEQMEKEQMKKEQSFAPPTKPEQNRGRKPFDLKKHPMLFIVREDDEDPKKAKWIVTPAANRVRHQRKVFKDCQYQGKKNSFKEAKKYRNEFIKNQKKGGIN